MLAYTPAQFYRWAIIGAASLFVGLLLFRLVPALRSPADDYQRGFVAGQLHAHNKLLAARHDVARAASVAAETVYVAARQKANHQVANVEPVSIAGDTITFADDSSFAIPHRVTLLIVEQRDAIAAQDSALQAADELLAKFRVERDATDSLHAGLAQENAALREQVRAMAPGRLARGWNAVKMPLALTAGVALGAFVTSRVIR